MKRFLIILLASVPLISNASATYYLNFLNSSSQEIEMIPYKTNCIDSIFFADTYYDGRPDSYIGTPATGVQIVDQNPFIGSCSGAAKVATFKVYNSMSQDTATHLQTIQFRHYYGEVDSGGGYVHKSWITQVTQDPDLQNSGIIIRAKCKDHGANANSYQNCAVWSGSSDGYASSDDQDIVITFMNQ